MVKVGEIARKNNLQEGYRIVVNDGVHGGQTVSHLHIHIIGGQ
jgi:histidine triad (HIT) family protein